MATFDDIQSAIGIIRRQFNTVSKMKRNGSSVKVIKYEDFYNNFETVYGAIENLMGFKINEKIKPILKDRFSPNSVKDEISKFKSFGEWDKLTHFHGNHIYKADTGTWKELLDEKDHDKLTKTVKDVLKEFGYDY